MKKLHQVLIASLFIAFIGSAHGQTLIFNDSLNYKSSSIPYEIYRRSFLEVSPGLETDIVLPIDGYAYGYSKGEWKHSELDYEGLNTPNTAPLIIHATPLPYVQCDYYYDEMRAVSGRLFKIRLCNKHPNEVTLSVKGD